MVRGWDRVNKDEKYVNRLKVMSNLMNQIPEKKEDELPDNSQMVQGPLGQIESPEDKCILLAELPKVLFLNNKDPKKYNLEYWSVHFNIEPQKLKNVFNYVGYGIPNITKDKETGRVFRFIFEVDN